MNEPVAYMMESPSAKWFLLKPDECLPNETCTPLYTHPMRELTDEEIEDFTARIYNCRTGAEAHEIVLAILRKAQEK